MDKKKNKKIDVIKVMIAAGVIFFSVYIMYAHMENAQLYMDKKIREYKYKKEKQKKVEELVEFMDTVTKSSMEESEKLHQELETYTKPTETVNLDTAFGVYEETGIIIGDNLRAYDIENKIPIQEEYNIILSKNEERVIGIIFMEDGYYGLLTTIKMLGEQYRTLLYEEEDGQWFIVVFKNEEEIGRQLATEKLVKTSINIFFHQDVQEYDGYVGLMHFFILDTLDSIRKKENMK